MDILISHESALAFWRNNIALVRNASGSRSRRAMLAPSVVPSFDAAALRNLVHCDALRDDPIHLLVSVESGRPRLPGIAGHVSARPLPAGALCRVCKLDGVQVKVVSPEILYCQLAPSLPFEERVMLGFELCGRYRRESMLSGAPSTEYGFHPATSAEKMARVAASGFGAYTERCAMSSLRYVLNGSRSPAESALAMLLSLPVMRGGYGLPAPTLNHGIPLKAQGRLTGRFECDLCWPDHHVALEYDSNQEHTGAEHINRDAIRYNRLKSMGYDVFIATWGQVRSTERMDRLANDLADALGVRIRIRVADYRDRQKQLRGKVLS